MSKSHASSEQTINNKILSNAGSRLLLLVFYKEPALAFNEVIYMKSAEYIKLYNNTTALLSKEKFDNTAKDLYLFLDKLSD